MSGDTKSTPTKQTSETPETHKPSTEYLEVLKEEMLVTAGTLGASLDEMAISGYLEALIESRIRIDLLCAAFKKLRREYTFHTMPLPAEIIEAAHIERERMEFDRPMLPQGNAEEWSKEDRESWAREMAEVREKLQPIAAPLPKAVIPPFEPL